jgi:hypothetical protein
MATKKAKTIAKLVDLKRKSVETREAAHALAAAATEAAEQARINADRAWLSALDLNDTVGTIADLADRDMYVRGLRRTVDVAEELFYTARTDQNEKLAAMTSARIDLRKYETWLERDAATQAEELRRVERVAEDEVAARNRRAG